MPKFATFQFGDDVLDPIEVTGDSLRRGHTNGKSRFTRYWQHALTQLIDFINAIVTGNGQLQGIQLSSVGLVAGSSPYTVIDGDFLILCDATAGAITVNLPSASDGTRLLAIKKIDNSANAITISRAGSDTIDGATTQALALQYNSYMLQSDGTATWNII